jgi:hypothetical protein
MVIKITGSVEEKVVQRGDKDGKAWTRIAFTVGGKTFSTFDIASEGIANKGDLVEVEYEVNGKYNNLKGIKKLEEKIGQVQQGFKAKGDYNEKLNKRISRMNALKGACQVLEIYSKLEPEKTKVLLEQKEIVEVVKEISEKLLEYTDS